VNVPDSSPKPENLEHESSVLPANNFVRFELNRREPVEGFIPALLHVNEKGKILWGSSPALSLLRTYCDWTKQTAQLPPPLKRMVSCGTNGSSAARRNELLIGGKQGVALYVRLIEDNKRLFLLLYERSASTPTSTRGLTKRETEVFQWLAAGKSNKDIATILAISPRTVEKHLGRIFQFLGVETRTAAAAEFYRLSNYNSALS